MRQHHGPLLLSPFSGVASIFLKNIPIIFLSPGLPSRITGTLARLKDAYILECILYSGSSLPCAPSLFAFGIWALGCRAVCRVHSAVTMAVTSVGRASRREGGAYRPMSGDYQNPLVQDPTLMREHYQAAPPLVVGSPHRRSCYSCNTAFHTDCTATRE